MGNTMSKKLVVCVRSVEKAEYHIKESDLIPENDEEINTTLEMAYCPTCEVVLDIIHLMNEK